MRKNYKFILGVIVGAIIFTTIGVYAATQIISSQVTYKDNKSVQDAIDELYDKANNNCPEGYICKKPICKRATVSTLHTETCSQTSNYCVGAGYTTGSTIVYGNETVTKGTLTSGDAFDCDVNGDGTYDDQTERFYYVSNYYNTTTKQFDTSKAVLIYYNNVSGGVANNTAIFAYYGSALENWHGPVTAKAQFPTTSKWSNVSLKNTERAILNEAGGNITTGGTLPTNFSYSEYAARLLTAQEVNAACNITVGSYPTGELDDCQYLMENTKFANSSLTFGYWLETPLSSDYYSVFLVYSNFRVIGYTHGSNVSEYGVRPVIEVSVTDIEY